MISFDEAVARVVEAAIPLGTEAVPVSAAAGRFLAAPVTAQIDSPRADCSAMDGYAARDADLPVMRLVGASYPGAAFEGVLQPGECVRIFTGAALPAGADRVVVQEIVTAEGDAINVVGEVGEARHIRRLGSDFRAGDELLPRGRRLDPRALVAAAGADRGSIEVGRMPRIAVLGTGDELAAPGTAWSLPQSIPESVSIGVAALVEEQGGSCISRDRLPDDLAALEAAAARALGEADLVVMTGGASVGDKDYAKAVFERLELQLIFSKVAIKPGKPVWFGRVGTTLVMGLPGNPTSALVTGRLLLAPLVRGLAGGEPREALAWRTACLAEALPPCGSRETFVRGRWRDGAVEALGFQDSSAQRALAEAELLIRRRAGAAAAAAGEEVEIIGF